MLLYSQQGSRKWRSRGKGRASQTPQMHVQRLEVWETKHSRRIKQRKRPGYRLPAGEWQGCDEQCGHCWHSGCVGHSSAYGVHRQEVESLFRALSESNYWIIAKPSGSPTWAFGRFCALWTNRSEADHLGSCYSKCVVHGPTASASPGSWSEVQKRRC